MYISSDTNVWIDFQDIGFLEQPFRLDHQFYLSRDAFQDEFVRSEAMKQALLQYGLHLADVQDEEFLTATEYQVRYSRLSVYDALALAIAKNRGWILLSGDGPLRNAAATEGVECHGTIWVCDQLKQQGKVTETEYAALIEGLIRAVKCGRSRLPMSELQKRKE